MEDKGRGEWRWICGDEDKVCVEIMLAPYPLLSTLMQYIFHDRYKMLSENKYQSDIEEHIQNRNKWEECSVNAKLIKLSHWIE